MTNNTNPLIPVSIATAASAGTIFVHIVGEGYEEKLHIPDGKNPVRRIDAALRALNVGRTTGYELRGNTLVARGTAAV